MRYCETIGLKDTSIWYYECLGIAPLKPIVYVVISEVAIYSKPLIEKNQKDTPCMHLAVFGAISRKL